MTHKQVLASSAEWLTYRLWIRWRGAEAIETRRMALKAKTHAVVVWDRIMRASA